MSGVVRSMRTVVRKELNKHFAQYPRVGVFYGASGLTRPARWAFSRRGPRLPGSRDRIGGSALPVRVSPSPRSPFWFDVFIVAWEFNCYYKDSASTLAAIEMVEVAKRRSLEIK